MMEIAMSIKEELAEEKMYNVRQVVQAYEVQK